MLEVLEVVEVLELLRSQHMCAVRGSSLGRCSFKAAAHPPLPSSALFSSRVGSAKPLSGVRTPMLPPHLLGMGGMGMLSVPGSMEFHAALAAQAQGMRVSGAPPFAMPPGMLPRIMHVPVGPDGKVRALVAAWVGRWEGGGTDGWV